MKIWDSVYILKPGLGVCHVFELKAISLITEWNTGEAGDIHLHYERDLLETGFPGSSYGLIIDPCQGQGDVKKSGCEISTKAFFSAFFAELKLFQLKAFCNVKFCM